MGGQMFGQGLDFCGTHIRTDYPDDFEEKAQKETIFYDRFGNAYLQSELIIDADAASLGFECNSGMFNLVFEVDPTGNPLSVQEQETVCAVFRDLSNLLDYSFPDNTFNIRVESTTDFNNPSTLATGSGTILNSDCGYINTTLYHALNGTPFVEEQIHGIIRIRSSLDWHTVNDPADATVIPPTTFDLYTVVLHEVLHMLGFASYTRPDGIPPGAGIPFDFINDPKSFSQWDEYLYMFDDMSGNYNPLIVNDAITDICCNPLIFNSAVDRDEILNNFTCNTKVAFSTDGGTTLLAPVNKTGFQDFATMTEAEIDGYWVNKLSHFQVSCASEVGVIAEDYVIHPILDFQEQRRYLTETEIHALCALGYNINTPEGIDEAALNCLEPYCLPNIVVEDEIIINGFGSAPSNIITIDKAALLANDIFTGDINTLDISFDISHECNNIDASNMAVIFDETTENFTMIVNNSIEAGIYSICYSISCGELCETGHINIYVFNPTVTTNCTPADCNLLCFGDFENFIFSPEFFVYQQNNGFTNQMNDIGFSQFSGASYGNSGSNADLIKISPEAGNPIENKCVRFATFGLDEEENAYENIVLPLSMPVPSGCEVVINLDIAAIGFCTSSLDCTLPTSLFFYGLDGEPTEDSPAYPDAFLDCNNGFDLYAGGPAAYPLLNGTDCYANFITDDQTACDCLFLGANWGDGLTTDDFTNTTFTLTNTATEPLTHIMLLAGVIDDADNEWTRYLFIDNINITTPTCEPEITATVSSTPVHDCESGTAAITYNFCIPESLGNTTFDVNMSFFSSIGLAFDNNPANSDFSNGTTSISLPADGSYCVEKTLSFLAECPEYTETVNINMLINNITSSNYNGNNCVNTVVPVSSMDIQTCDCAIEPLCLAPYSVTDEHPLVNPVEFDILTNNLIPAYVVQNSGTWNSTNNEFITNLGVPSGSDIVINFDLIIPDDVNLVIQDMNFSFGPLGRVIVRSRGSLTIDNSLLTSACDIMWQGIQVRGFAFGPVVSHGNLTITNNTIIEHAYYGVGNIYLPLIDPGIIQLAFANNFQDLVNVTTLLLPQIFANPPPLNAAGNVNVFNSNFNNCLVGLLLTNNYDNVSTAISSSFNYDGTPLHYPFNFNNTLSEAGIQGFLTAGLKIQGCEFNNLKYGVRTTEVLNNKSSQCDFNNCIVGISSRNHVDGDTPSLDALGNNFMDCQIAIQADNGNICTIRNNNINLSDTPYTNPYVGENTLGMYLRGCNGEVWNNNIHNVTLGMVINDNFEDGLIIGGNDISDNNVAAAGNILQGAVISYGNNLGVELSCNHFGGYSLVGLDIYEWSDTGNEALLANQGDCGGLDVPPAPAANTFIGAAGSTDIARDASATVNFNYEDVGAGSLTVSDLSTSANINTVSCDILGFNPDSYCNDIGFYPLAVVDIIDDEIKKNRELSKHLVALVEAEDYAGALTLIYEYDSDMTERRRISHEIQTGETNNAQARLDNYAIDSDEDLRYKQYQQLQLDLKASGRTYHQISPAEEALLYDIAYSKTHMAYKAQSMLYIARFVEFEVAIPDLSGNNANINTAFKTQENMVNAYPNPAKTILYIPYALAQEGVLNVYNVQGILVHSVHLATTGIYALSLANYESGLYFYELKTTDKLVRKEKVVIVK